MLSLKNGRFFEISKIMEKGERKGFALLFICMMRVKGYFTV